jgi:hypothetical protein
MHLSKTSSSVQLHKSVDKFFKYPDRVNIEKTKVGGLVKTVINKEKKPVGEPRKIRGIQKQSNNKKKKNDKPITSELHSPMYQEGDICNLRLRNMTWEPRKSKEQTLINLKQTAQKEAKAYRAERKEDDEAGILTNKQKRSLKNLAPLENDRFYKTATKVISPQKKRAEEIFLALPTKTIENEVLPQNNEVLPQNNDAIMGEEAFIEEVANEPKNTPEFTLNLTESKLQEVVFPLFDRVKVKKEPVNNHGFCLNFPSVSTVFEMVKVKKEPVETNVTVVQEDEVLADETELNLDLNGLIALTSDSPIDELEQEIKFF